MASQKRGVVVTSCIQRQGTIYLFGKVQTRAASAKWPAQFQSACVVVHGAETTLLVLPKATDASVDETAARVGELLYVACY